jgi:4-hydroxybenzoate polyprenyltransferase
MMRLLAEAVYTGHLGDALFVGAIALVITAVSALLRNKRWFLLGGISLLAIVFYLTRAFWESLPWWAYLLLAGATLTGIAIYHEAKKNK